MKEFSNHCKSSIMLQIWNNSLDAEDTLRCLTELKNYSESEQDTYATIFTHTFLGKFYISQNQEETAANHLFTAKELMLSEKEYEQLLLRLNFYLGVLFDRREDRQIGTDYYMEAISIALAHNEQEMLCKIYNNIAFSLECYQCYDKAVPFYDLALNAAEKSKNDALVYCIQIHMVLPLIMLSRLEEANKHIEKCNHYQKMGRTFIDFTMRNLCCYYAAANQLDKANEQAALILINIDTFRKNKFSVFYNFFILYQCMYNANNQKYADLFLAEMEFISANGNQLQKWRASKARLEYYRKFEPQKDCMNEYERFYLETRAHKKIINSITAEAMHFNLALSDFMKKHEDLIHEKKSLELEANIDELTQVYNRRFFEDYIDPKSTFEISGSFSIIMLDIDYFKEYNDFYGHSLGDDALKAVARCLKDHAPDGMYVCRYGGDEFVCLGMDLSDEIILKYIREVQYHLDQLGIAHQTSRCADKLTLSIGCSTCPNTEPNYGINAFRLADEQLYAAKLQGRNTFSGI